MSKKISLLLAIIININIVIGGGFFLSLREGITNDAGSLAYLSWILVGFMLIPLTFVLANLSQNYPVSGGLYIYSQKMLGSFWGFISGWGYYIGTAAGNAVILHAFRRLSEQAGFTTFLTKTFGIGGFSSDIFFISLFAIFNFFNIEILGKVQTIFTILKTIPFILVIGASLLLFKTTNLLSIATPNVADFLRPIPIVLFAYIGLEACCAIGHIIKDAKKNTSKAILTSLIIIIGVYGLIQFLLLGIHGTESSAPFLGLLPKLTSNPIIIHYGNLLIQAAILSSFLGGFYSMFYTNNWNLYAMAKENQLPFSNSLVKTNQYEGPWVCIIIQALIITAFLAITKNVAILITMSDFGVIIAYILSCLAFILLYKKAKIITGILALISCGYLFYICFNNLLVGGAKFLIPFLLIFALGIVGYKIKTTKGIR